MRYLGQHFLKNKGAINTAIMALDLQRGERIIEIGPGHGELTFPLEEACIQMGCTLTAIERDTVLAAALSEKTSDGTSGLRAVLTGNALELLPAVIQSIGDAPYKIVGNIPYYITGKLMRTLGELPRRPLRTVLMVQREVAERMCAAPPRMNRLAASVQFWGTPKIIATLRPEDFSPPPKVSSAIVTIEAHPSAREEYEQYDAAVHALFAQPRKTVLNNLFAKLEKNSPATKENVAAILESAGIPPAARPQDLDVEDVQAVARAFF